MKSIAAQLADRIRANPEIYAATEARVFSAKPEFVTLPLNAMRCEVCGHRFDDMDGCDSCAADREALTYDEEDDDGREGMPEFNGAFGG